ncbi:hypothetical protein CBL_06254 [Carabus blaptoides fortunei]
MIDPHLRKVCIIFHSRCANAIWSLSRRCGKKIQKNYLTNIIHFENHCPEAQRVPINRKIACECRNIDTNSLQSYTSNHRMNRVCVLYANNGRARQHTATIYLSIHSSPTLHEIESETR